MAVAFAAGEGRLSVRPKAPSGERYRAGTHKIAVPKGREALLYLPDSADLMRQIPLVVSLHGAGGNATNALRGWREEADRNGFAVLSPASRSDTWDVIVGGFGPDVSMLDAVLAAVFDRVSVAPDRVAVSGFSDGASYALSIGVTNGDLFRDILAFSPGFMTAPAKQGKPDIFVSHGTRDEVLPIDRCSRVLVPKLRQAGYKVEYREFDGPHTVPGAIRADAIAWWNRLR